MANVNFKKAVLTLLGQPIPYAGGFAAVPAGTDATEPVVAHPNNDESIWHESSLDLSIGLDTVEHPIDTLPGELRDLFRPE